MDQFNISIQAGSADELRSKIIAMADQFSIQPKTMKVSLTLPNQPPPPSAEPVPQASIFDSAPPVAAKKSSKVKVAAPVEEVIEPEVVEVKADKTLATNLSREVLADKLREVIARCGGNVARDMMAAKGYSHLGKIPESDFAKFMELAEETINTKAKKSKKE